MSEAIPGLPPAPPAAKPRDAAAVLLFRRTPQGPELFWVRRGEKLQFSGGFFAFPGGKVDKSDVNVPVENARSPDDRPLVAAAARELFEEAGVLVCSPRPKLTQAQLDASRQALLEAKTTFIQLLAELHAHVDANDFVPAGRWVTPPFLPIRFDARFYLVEAPPEQKAEVWEGELADGGFITPSAALERWSQGTALLHPPNLHALRTFAAFTTLESALLKLRDPPHAPNFVPQRIEFQRGVHILPLLSPTLPPATHTNCYLLGEDELLIVDPGSPDPREQARLAAFVTGLQGEGKRLKAIVLTHHHGDHVGGALAAKQRLKVPIWAHELTANRVEGVERILTDGEVLTLKGRPNMRWRVVHTPGHAKGHVCLYDLDSRALVCGDMVAGVGSILIDPPEGDLAEYLASLERLAALPAGALYAAHGPTIVNGVQKLREYAMHRQMRELAIYDAVQKGPLGIPEIVARVYTDTPPELHLLAERSALASLIKLTRDGKVVRDGERYRAAK